ncbi:hypothetical protein POX_g09226 [Penicillium oxalicum]|nr:hypothetical protein POX_g09226 [Penicillium oxalicum]KAI2786831.1 hypothetical protein POX_g09226 [Penicillium oxalicum]
MHLLVQMILGILQRDPLAFGYTMGFSSDTCFGKLDADGSI